MRRVESVICYRMRIQRERNWACSRGCGAARWCLESDHLEFWRALVSTRPGCSVRTCSVCCLPFSTMVPLVAAYPPRTRHHSPCATRYLFHVILSLICYKIYPLVLPWRFLRANARPHPLTLHGTRPTLLLSTLPLYRSPGYLARGSANQRQDYPETESRRKFGGDTRLDPRQQTPHPQRTTRTRTRNATRGRDL